MRRSFDFRKRNQEKHRGMEVIEITPVILGGDPADPDNRCLVNREQHFEVVRYWNGIIAELSARERI